ncbi:MAG: transporter, partial [Chitinophagia bacterium]|nr:transporter [Chitinophagia bacterium]
RIGNEDVFYDATKRFNALQAGIALPLFGGAQQAKLSAIKINETIVKNNYTIALNQYSTRYNSLTIDYTARLKVVAYYKQTGLPNASLIIEKASLQYQGGDISYQQYALLINQALTIKNEYLDQAYELNKVIVELNNY